MIAEGEFSTALASGEDVPQPHVSRGYSPLPPALPSFETIAELPNIPVSSSESKPMIDKGQSLPAQGSNSHQSQFAEETGPLILIQQNPRTFRRVAAFLVVVGLFTGILYGTASYIRGRSVIPEAMNPFRPTVAVANTDIYLRPNPNTNNDPIGLVTKNSKVRIVNTQNNWYQVDVVQQGRVRPSQLSATRGWLNGRYLDIGDN